MKIKHPELILLIVTFCWAFSFPLLRNAGFYMDGSLFLCIRFILASILITPLVIYNRKRITKKRLLKSLVLGFFIFLIISLTFAGLLYTSGANIAVFTGLNLIIVPILWCIFKKKKIKRKNIIAIILGFLGIFLLSGGININFKLGDGIGVIIGIISSIQIIVNKVLTKGDDSFIIGITQIYFATIFGFILFFGTYLFGVVPQNPFQNIASIYIIIPLIVTALLGTAIAFPLQTYIQKFVSPGKTALIFASEPAFGVILSTMILLPNGTRAWLTISQIIGILVIAFAIIITETNLINKFFRKVSFPNSKSF